MTAATRARRVVVGIDGSPAGAAALRWAIDEATRRRAGVDAVHAWHPPQPVLPDGVIAAIDPAPFEQCASATLEDAIYAIYAADAALAGVDVRALPVQGHPAYTLIDRSRTAVMLVVGARHSFLHGPGLGSVSHQCVLHAECPVVVVPNGWIVEPGRGRVVVGVDGSPASHDALAWAAEAAVERGAALDVVHAWHPVGMPMPPGATPADYRDDLSKDSRLLLEHMARGIPNPSPREVQLLAVDDTPADALCAVAQRADLLVVGCRGRGGFARLLLGSVSQRCLHRAPCPVAVLRHPGERAWSASSAYVGSLSSALG